MISWYFWSLKDCVCVPKLHLHTTYRAEWKQFQEINSIPKSYLRTFRALHILFCPLPVFMSVHIPVRLHLFIDFAFFPCIAFFLSSVYLWVICFLLISLLFNIFFKALISLTRCLSLTLFPSMFLSPVEGRMFNGPLGAICQCQPLQETLWFLISTTPDWSCACVLVCIYIYIRTGSGLLSRV